MEGEAAVLCVAGLLVARLRDEPRLAKWSSFSEKKLLTQVCIPTNTQQTNKLIKSLKLIKQLINKQHN